MTSSMWLGKVYRVLVSWGNPILFVTAISYAICCVWCLSNRYYLVPICLPPYWIIYSWALEGTSPSQFFVSNKIFQFHIQIFLIPCSTQKTNVLCFSYFLKMTFNEIWKRYASPMLYITGNCIDLLGGLLK